MEYVFPTVVLTFQVYLIYLSVKGFDKNNRLNEINCFNVFLILFLLHDHLIFLFIGYIFLILFVLDLYKKP